MEHRALAGLILRIAGLLIVVSAITNFTQSLGPLLHSDAIQKIGVGLLLLSAVISLVIPVVLGLVLIYFPSAVTTKVLRIDPVEAASEVQVRPLQQVAFAVVGLWFTVHAILDLVYVFAKSQLYVRMFEDLPAYAKLPPVTPEDLASYVSSGLQLLIGIWLLFGSRGFGNAISRLRG